MYKTAYNPGNTPLVVDADGHSIGGGEWGTVQTTADEASALIDAKMLSVFDGDDAPEGASAEFVNAFNRTQVIADRAKALQKLDAARVAELAEEADVDATTKTDQTASPAPRTDVAIPDKSKKTASKSAGSKES